MANGTITMEDIYGNGTLDTVPADKLPTSQKTNPNDISARGEPLPHEQGFFSFLQGGNILGQPLTIWVGLIILLIIIKYFDEK